MPKFLRNKVIDEILRVGLIPVFYNDDIETVKMVVKACSDGGTRTIEFTNRGDRAYDVFNELSRWCDEDLPEVILGAGTVIDPATAVQYINAGANFVVGPLLNPEVASACNRRRVLYIPGCMTPTEISKAEEMGADIIKLFPASVLTPRFIKAFLGPSPYTHLMPSGGVRVERENITEWIEAGSAALNIGSELIRRDLVEGRKFDVISENVAHCITWIEQARGRQAP